MRIEFMFQCEKNISLPIHYNEIIHGFIYNHLEAKLGHSIHDVGFAFEKRNFKLFTFSRLMGRSRIDSEFITIFSPFKLIISSPFDELLRSFSENLIKDKSINIGNNKLQIKMINVLSNPSFKEEVLITMLSPVTVYSTLRKPDNSKKTYYYHPSEKEFSHLIRNNLLKKYYILFREMPSNNYFEIKPVYINKNSEKILKYKNFIIKGWMGRYNIKGNPDLIKIAYDTGIGSKNSLGFGCFDVIN